MFALLGGCTAKVTAPENSSGDGVEADGVAGDPTGDASQGDRAASDPSPGDRAPYLCGDVAAAPGGELITLLPGEWYEFPNSALNASAVAYVTGSGSAGAISTNRKVAGTLDAWSGGAYDSRRNRLLSHGGGHWWYAQPNSMVGRAARTRTTA